MAAVAPPDRDVLRRLAEVDVADGSVLSVFIDLDPREFANSTARRTAITSAVDEAARIAEDDEHRFAHEARVTLREDVERVREYLDSADFDGTRGMAVFAAGQIGLFEPIHLPHPVESLVMTDTAPHLAPLTSQSSGAWCVVLVNRRSARFLCGGSEGLREEELIKDHVHGQHDQGGWSQARYERSVDEEAMRHYRHVAVAIRERWQNEPFDHLVVGGPEDAYSDFAELLDKRLRDLLVGRVDVDVENSNADQVAEAAEQVMREYEQRRHDELLTRLHDGLGMGGRAAAGLEDTLEAINEQRVEVLLLDANFSTPGVECPHCGWIGSGTESHCPLDGTELEQRSNVVDPAVERTFAQDADVVSLRERPEIAAHGGIAAILRF